MTLLRCLPSTKGEETLVLQVCPQAPSPSLNLEKGNPNAKPFPKAGKGLSDYLVPQQALRNTELCHERFDLL